MNANQRRKFARAFVADLKAATEGDITKGLVEAAEEHMADQRQINWLETEIASLKQQLEVAQCDIKVRDDYVEELRQRERDLLGQLEVYEANTARFIAADKSMQQQLAASHATNSKLREALGSLYEYSSLLNHTEHCGCDPYVSYTCSGCRFANSEPAMVAKTLLAI